VPEDVLVAHIERSGGRAHKLRDLARTLGVPKHDWRAFREQVRVLVESGRLRQGTNRRVAPATGGDGIVGRLQGLRGGGAFLLREDAPDVYVSAANQRDAVHGDLVSARLRRTRGRLEALVERVVERGRSVLVGTLQTSPHGWFLVPDDARIVRDLRLEPGIVEPRHDQVGFKAIARIAGMARDGDLLCELVAILGRPDAPGVRTRALKAEFDLPESFAAEVEASVAAARPPSSQELGRREDFSALLAFTIDPHDAKDHDDAVTLQRLPEGGFELGVHIADVSHYVPPNSAVDVEGEARATSVYLADCVVPMLPEILSNHVCSLRPGVPRLTLSVLLRFDVHGVLQGARLAESWIVSRVKLSYQAAEALFGDREPAPGHWATSSSEASGEASWPGLPSWTDLRPRLRNALADMRHLATLLRAQRMAAGSLDIETTELRAEHDAHGRVIGMQVREDLESYGVIEEFMLAANQAVARTLTAAHQPLLWRTHDVPDGRAAEELRLFLKKLGIEWSYADPPSQQDFQRLLRAITRRPERKYLMYRVLRSLKKAQYEARRKPHFGLAFAQYTHFTSPIRRYPDLYNHRLVRHLIRGGGTSGADPGRRGGALVELGVHTSERELAAADAERASLKLKLCELLVDRAGETGTGCISAITDHGLYVDVAAWHAEGLVHVSSMNDDDWVPDLQRTQIRGARSRRTLRFGQEVRVQLLHVDPDRRQIDLALVRER